MIRNRLYAFAGQSAVVRALLRAAGLGTERGSVIFVTKPDHLRGLDGGTFAVVKNHAWQVPAEMMEVVARNGMYLMELSDEFARARAALPLAVRLRDEEGPPLPQIVAQRRAQLTQP